jgi:hypothetical protein
MSTVIENERRIMSIKEARKFLGKESLTLSDTEVEKLLKSLQKFAETFLEINSNSSP